MKKTKTFFLIATLIFAASPTIANDNTSNHNTKVPSLDPANQGYMNSFCTYHPASPLCIVQPNPPAKTPSASAPTANNDNNGPVRVPLPASSSSCATPLPKSFAPITECGPTVNVTPATLKSNIGNGCKTLILAPGSYALNISGHSDGVLTLRCAVKWACDVKVDSSIRESSGIIVDGISMDGRCTSNCHKAATGFLTLTNTSNIKIQNSKFNNMLGTGVLVDQANENKQFNIQLVGNTLHNDIERSFQISRSGRWSYDMDYGFRIHDANSVYIANNTFTGGFNHAVSLKRLVKYALIENNNFVSCGNACVHAGQQGNTTANPNISSDLIEIRNNRFSIQTRQDRSAGVEVMNVHKAIVTNNSFTGFIGDRALHLFYFSDGYNGLSGYINRGVPADRQLIQSGNGSAGGGISAQSGACSTPTASSPLAALPALPRECTAARGAATVSASNFSSAMRSLSSGTIVLAPGSYPAFNLSGKSFNNAVIQCAQPGACRFGNSKLSNVSGLTIDGILVQGGGLGLDISGSRNVTVRCSTFKEQTGSGILLTGSSSNQVRLQNNTFYNGATGCQYGNNNCSGQLSNGSPVASMDYGIRIHQADNVEMVGNRFTGPGGKGLFNHSISLKESVSSAVIRGNIFDACGRNCIEPGQQDSNTHDGDISCGTVTITGNIFNNVKSTRVLVKNIHRVIYSGNTFNNSTGPNLVLYNFTKSARGYPLLNNATTINGRPKDRTVSGNGG